MRNSQTSKITAYIARKVQYAESDLILTLLSREEGRVDAIARGARKSRKRFEAGLSYYMMYEGTISRRGESSLWFLKELSVIRMFPTLLEDYTKISTAAYGTELAREMIPPHQEEEALFDLLTTFYHSLDTAADPGFLIPWLQYNVLAWSGYIPHAHECSSCHRPGGEGFWSMRPADGAMLCDACAPDQLARQHWKNFAWLHTMPPVPPDPETANRFKSLLTRLTTNTLGKTLRAGTLL